MRTTAEALKAAYDAHSVSEERQEFRWHLGASMIGHHCARFLTYDFRWCAPREKLQGYQARIFQEGRRKEEEIKDHLNTVGMKLETHTPDGKQFKYSGVHGHYGGSVDAKSFFEPMAQPVVWEIKTHNTKNFSKVVQNGVQAEQPKHFAQICAYGAAFSTDYGIYVAYNKNDSDIHFEIVEIDHNLAKELEYKAEQIITAQALPIKYSNDPAHFKCKICPARGVCHAGQPYEVNCRSCSNSNPTENGEWWCRHYQAIIPRHVVVNPNCEHYREFGRL